MRVTVTFHGPFRVATGTGRPGIDDTVDRGDLLPASSLKGLMRHSAERLLPDLPQLVEAVFGGPRCPTAWGWEAARFPDEPVVVTRARVSLDEDSGAARRDHLLFGEEVWARTAEFTVTQFGPLPQSDGPPLDRDGHLTVLACAAAGVHSLGAVRRRGLGWVQCTPEDPGIGEELITRFMTLAEQWRRHRDA
ncbi:RAMP superfamily CRISPR-associated protein [Streptomyces sp. NPDC093707]|uniref:RAMP superfamily CRISPR-associated protein n=1 Tax=Streptomyces sp. NPDC093707 TaxID=3154984 RepID=UPI00344F1271